MAFGTSLGKGGGGGSWGVGVGGTQYNCPYGDMLLRCVVCRAIWVY